MMKSIAIAFTVLVALAGCDRFGGAGTTANGTGAPASNSAGTGFVNSLVGSQTGQQSASADGKPAAPDAGSQPQSGAAPPASDQGSVQLDRAFMVGRWGDNRACDTSVMELTQDGRMIASRNGSAEVHHGLWDLQGSQLTLSGSGVPPLIWQISPIDHNTITVTMQTGALAQMMRC